MPHRIVCVGEILWDALPMGLFLGGAPFNVAYHLHTLGENVTLVSCVGDDVLGREALRRVRKHGMVTDYVQVDPDLDTGFVEVTVDNEGDARYVILEPVAWDNIQLEPSHRTLAESASAIVFGSLAQRSPETRTTIRALCEAEALKAYDVNLRPPYVTWPIVEASLELADLVKMSEAELHQIIAWCGLEGCVHEGIAAIAERFECVVCVTRGPRGALLRKDGRSIEQPGYQIEVADTVGVGDAFLAGLLYALLDEREDDKLLGLANRLGAYVAGRYGSTPLYDPADLDAIDDLPYHTAESEDGAVA